MPEKESGAGRVLGLMFFVLVWLMTWTGSELAYAQMPKVRVAYPTLGGVVLPAWIAKDAGLDRKHGVDSEVIFLRGGTPTIQGLIGKSFEFTILSGASLTMANLGGADVVMVACYFNRLNFKIVVRPEITEPKALIGQKMGVQSFTGASAFAAKAGLRKLGLNSERDVQLISMGENQAILIGMESRAVASGSISDPHGFMASKFGFKVLYDFGKSDMPYANMGVLARRDYAISHEQIVTRYLQAQMEAVRYLLANPERAKKVLSRYTRIADPEVLDYTYQVFTGYFNPSLMLDPAGMKTVYEGLAEQRSDAKNLNPRAFLYDSIITKIQKSGFPEELDRFYPGTRR